ncbi:MAG: methylated-DNA--[protein]-cysteine S-methyltransferase [Rubrobacteraceae bacterium]
MKVSEERISAGKEFEPRIERGLADATDSFFSVESPLGTLYVAVGEKGIKYSTPAPASDEEFVRHYGETFGRLVVPAEDTEELSEKISAAFAGERVEIPLDLSDRTPFQRRVMEVVSGIPRGEVRPYSWVAKEAGAARASRAVGSVMAKNPMPLILPCHRVIRNDGGTGNYGYDPERKVRLLKDEGVPVEEIAKAPYVATPATGVFCHATCRNAKRTKPENRRPFRSASAAVDAGFRPCEVCRPVVAA